MSRVPGDQLAGLSAEARSRWLAEPAALPRLNDDEIAAALDDATTVQLLLAMKRRGGTFAAVADAQMLVMRKSEDYNRDALADGAAAAKRDVYFPFGTVSYAQMIHTKAQRFVSIARAVDDGGRPNFEGLLDTALDVINYAAFYVEWATRTAKSVEHASGQKEAA